MKWENVTVEQFQKINALKKTDDLDFITEVVAILTGKTVSEVEDMPIGQFSELCREASKMMDLKELPGGPVDYIKVNGRKYKVIKDLFKSHFGQYKSSMHFAAQDVIESLHLRMASCVVPVRGWFNRPVKYSEIDHVQVVEDMKQASFIDCYHTAVFFYLYFRNLTTILTASMQNPELDRAMSDLVRITDGFIVPKRYQSWKISR